MTQPGRKGLYGVPARLLENVMPSRRTRIRGRACAGGEQKSVTVLSYAADLTCRLNPCGMGSGADHFQRTGASHLVRRRGLWNEIALNV